MMDQKILQLLACPCEKHGQLVQVDSHLRSLCCNKDYALIDGIPVLLKVQS